MIEPLTSEIVAASTGAWAARIIDQDGRSALAEINERAWAHDVRTSIHLLTILGSNRQMIITHPPGYAR